MTRARSSANVGKALERQAITIQPGGWAVHTERPLATLLGSCVAVCFYDARLGLAGMNHFLLPKHSRTRAADEDAVLSGDFAMEVLLNAMYARGAQRGRLVAKAFGGGNIVGAIQMAIGENNAAFAREWLSREGISLQAFDFGGAWSRKVIFDPATGDAFCRRTPVNPPTALDILRAEGEYEKALAASAMPQGTRAEKKIELF